VVLRLHSTPARKNAMENPVSRYLEDAIAAEKSFETQLRAFGGEAAFAEVQTVFLSHAEETKSQYDRLTARLHELGGAPSGVKSLLAHLFNAAPAAAQSGYSAEERVTQDLIMAYAVENAEIAMYESLAITASAFGDRDTEKLARDIQSQEKAAAGKVWKMIEPVAGEAFTRLSHAGRNPLIPYLEDTEAAERNFEDALASFSKMGNRSEVQSLMVMMSAKAKTQHERLERRLRALGGSPSTAKSILAHVLAFTPVSAQLGHSDAEKSAQHLMITYAAASAEMAMYESLAAAAHVADDGETERLARELQTEEKEDHSLAWDHLGRAAHDAVTVPVL
jgi:ferritin-like metal-binding protein YciE